ncbi:Hint domain-containing protein [Paracoccus sp. Z330]|uniref:Hint domain-containing protein n=1 Tax=Paracoccus onchidii TaxID=3017813 RepID=A0ABT4ZC15_9RHOB|nr:Hint domain-containing protein [Paracoccus onchidii]MDB6176902.1 Hint domain-containing protein [Paracoccus onchidii]
MDYQVTMLTLSQIIPTGTGTARYAPWSGTSSPITFPDGQLTTITIADDDPEFESSYYTPEETQQTLVHDTTFGYGAAEETIPAGTQLSNFIGSYIVDADGNRFQAVFPRDFTASTSDSELGEKYSVLLFPVENVDPDTGDVSYPEFSLENQYRFVSINPIGTADDSLDYPPSSVTCFVSGTGIVTTQGTRPIEKLAVGDLVLTRDKGFQAIRWIGNTRLDARQLDMRPQLRPIRIAKDALGDGTPQADLIVSPQHRVLVRSRIAARMFGAPEVLVAAKHLVGLPGIELMRNAQSVTYWHILFQSHEIVLSEGAWTESLYTGATALKSVSAAARREILSLFPELRDKSFSPTPARPLASGRTGRKLAERHKKNGKRLIAAT